MHLDHFSTDQYKDVIELLHGNGWTPESIPPRKAMIADAWTVYDDNDELAGFIRVLSDALTVTYVCEIVVAERHRGSGVGRMMLEHVASVFPDSRIDVLSTQGAKAFYEACGFTVRPGYRRYP
jgi:ribosomal protein S18 acetylase RimI-like enzyme